LKNDPIEPLSFKRLLLAPFIKHRVHISKQVC
jgi:hypothetical protein